MKAKHYALDNGSFSVFVNGTPFDDKMFLKSLDKVKDPEFIINTDSLRDDDYCKNGQKDKKFGSLSVRVREHLLVITGVRFWRN